MAMQSSRSIFQEDLSSSSQEEPSLDDVHERDEVKEIQKEASNDTRFVNIGRFAVTFALIVTAVVVTVTTYSFLRDEQNKSFNTAYEQFARGLSTAATERKFDLQLSLEGMSTHLSSYAINSNSSWPFVTMPSYERFAHNGLVASRSEIFLVINLVTEENVDLYVNYTDQHYATWVDEGHILAYESLDRLNRTAYKSFQRVPALFGQVNFCGWTMSPPPPSYGDVNTVFNFAFGPILDAVVERKSDTLVTAASSWNPPSSTMTAEDHGALHSSPADHPHSIVFAPVQQEMNVKDSPIVAILSAVVAWDTTLQNLLPSGVRGLTAVVRDTCNNSFTYRINGPEAIFVGDGDLHDPAYEAWEMVADLSLPRSNGDATDINEMRYCDHSLYIYPTEEFATLYDSGVDELFAVVVATTFGFMIAVFVMYDCLVQRRNWRLVMTAARSNAIVASLFPGTMRAHVLAGNGQFQGQTTQGNAKASQSSLKSYLLKNPNGGSIDLNSKPMAELFLETTIMFADIVGFTAWSSVREPSQVFVLLESVYGAFDAIAKQRRVFKVETVGDCYVAVAGLPEPRKDHAVVVARFARDCLSTMHDLAKELEVVLGPDTGDLKLRIGIHSGPVTAGVLRGERSRFQLFGDTMNTTSRLESTSEPGRIHLSEETAELIKVAGKEHWLWKRENKVTAKGKGELQTYWLLREDHFEDDNGWSPKLRTLAIDDHYASADLLKKDLPLVEDDPILDTGLSPRTQRLIDWNVDMLLRLLKQISALRNARSGTTAYQIQEKSSTIEGTTILDEVQEVITFPEFDSKAANRQQDPADVQFSAFVLDQLLDFVTCIASMYRDNPFHNFEHASHVAMSVGKLMSRIVAPSDSIIGILNEGGPTKDVESSRRKKAVAATMHDHTYGITSDPLTQFACAFSALIHDVDHTGVPNTQLVKENTTIAHIYKNRSVAEQNSFDLAWELLMDDRYADLRVLIFSNEEEKRRFRQLVINSVMATDIVDKDLKALRNGRWIKAFRQDDVEQPLAGRVQASAKTNESTKLGTNRKATIVIEHLIQASDVSHTMQHWHIFRKWNERLFMEMFKAHKEGRAEKDPSESWYEGEIGFFDFYVIPLAKKLKECGVFGVSSDEYLNYALRNRQEWADRGLDLVAEMREKAVQLT